jgi:hypothetical protein
MIKKIQSVLIIFVLFFTIQYVIGIDILCFITFQGVCKTNKFSINACESTVKARQVWSKTQIGTQEWKILTPKREYTQITACFDPKFKERKNYSDDGTVLIETVKVLPNERVIMYCRPNLEPYRNQSPWGIAVDGYKGHCKFEKYSEPSHLQVVGRGVPGY